MCCDKAVKNKVDYFGRISLVQKRDFNNNFDSNFSVFLLRNILVYYTLKVIEITFVFRYRLYFLI